jgi:hypothetical protein
MTLIRSTSDFDVYRVNHAGRTVYVTVWEFVRYSEVTLAEAFDDAVAFCEAI